MSRLNRSLGVLKSLAVHHGIPWRAAQLRRFYRPWVPAGGLAFDVGAQAGYRVRVWRALGARVVAIEPQPEFAHLLDGLFGGDAGVTVLPQAVGRAQSVRTQTVSASTPVTTLDALIANHGRPDFVKIDAGRCEPEMLQGLSAPLAALSFQYLVPARELALGCVEQLERLGRYRYRASLGERQPWLQREALDADGVRRWFDALPAGSPSGEMYARLDRR